MQHTDIKAFKTYLRYLRALLPLLAQGLLIEIQKPAATATNTFREDTMLTKLMTLIRDDEGATALEYGLIAALIAAVIVGAVTALGTRVQGTFQTITNAMPGAGG